MPQQIIEGTWEEIKQHEAELVGQYLRVTFNPIGTPVRKPNARPKNLVTATKPKALTGFGAFKGKVGSSEEFAREKREEIEREERRL